jgi:hypothetical protein
MRWIIASVPVFALILLPFISEAQIFGALSPTCAGNFGENCEFCNLVSLAQRIINFSVYMGIVVGTLMFTYAGVLYVTSAPNPGNIEKAHKIFWNVLIGLIIVLGAWLVVDVVMKTFYSGEFGPWNNILCQSGVAFEGGTGGSGGSGGTGGVGSGGGGSGVAHDSVMSAIGASTCSSTVAQTICVTSTSGPGGVRPTCSTGTGCTTLSGLQSGTVGTVNNLVNGCVSSTGSCQVVIVGGTEPGHASGAFSHGSGYKVDIDDADTGFNTYMSGVFLNGVNPVSTSVGPKYSVPQADGSTVNVIRESDHWDIQHCPSGASC